MSEVSSTIREILASQGRMSEVAGTLGDEDDLYDAGLSSHASVNVMLALEDEFDVEFPEALLRKSTFESVASIRAALLSIGVVDPPR